MEWCTPISRFAKQPENIVLCETEIHSRSINGRSYRLPDYLDVKIIDLGNVYTDDDDHSGTINTRQFRAPEVILRWIIRIV